MPRRVIACLAALAAAGVPAAAASGRGAVVVQFRLPSGNIGCAYVKDPGRAASLRCDIATGLKPAPPIPASCKYDFGSAVAMGVFGRPRVICVSDTALNLAAPVLAYGETWQRGGFRCVSRSTGLTCTNASRHGFFLSRQRSRLF